MFAEVLVLSLIFRLIPADSQFEFFKSRCDLNCTFGYDHLDSESFKAFPSNCTNVCAYLSLDENSNLSENELNPVFQNVKVLYGYLNVKNTKLKDLKFLKGLEKLECDEFTNLKIEYNSEMTTIGMTNFSATNCEILISENVKLDRFDLPNLKNFYITNSNNNILPEFTAKYLSPNFCITLEEMTNFMTSRFLNFGTFNVPFCNFSTPTNELFGEKVCEIRNFTSSNFDELCKRIIGNVIIENGDEQYVNKLKNVTWIFGTVKIYKTNLTTIDFLDSLEYVTNDPDGVVGSEVRIQVKGNKNLMSAVFPNLKNHRELIFKGSVGY
ncbi:hypothetical protein B9Z55_018365 [Caenorhabditis nigoni]|nr:hypothetical protein B9Z55_018365 [Caenorhabditis nigoni]